MAVYTEKNAQRFTDIVANTPLHCDWQLFAEADALVIYGSAVITAQIDVDYTVALNPPDYYSHTVTPTQALIDKINALIAADPTNEINYATVRRSMPKTQSLDDNSAGVRQQIREHFDKTYMLINQLNENIGRAVRVSPAFVGDEKLYTLPGPKANFLIGWDGTGENFINVIDKGEVANAEGHAQAAALSASDAAGSASSASTFAGEAADSATEAGNHVFSIKIYMLSPKAADPTNDDNGNPIAEGAMYFNTTTKVFRVYNGTAWVDISQITTVPDGAITTAKIVNNAVTEPKIGADQVSTRNLQASSVGATELKALNVNQTHIKADMTKTNKKTFRDALSADLVHNIDVPATGVWNTPANTVRIRFKYWGGGASGAGGGGPTSVGAGSGGGGYGEHLIEGEANIDATYTITIGSGGPTAPYGTGGVSGGTTSIVGTQLGTISAAGGVGAVLSQTPTNGGAGGVASGGNVANIRGQSGSASNTYQLHASGGGSPNGGFGGSNNVGTPGDYPGGGGAGGAAANGSGGAGANGRVLIEYWTRA